MRGRTAFAVIGACLAVLAGSSMAVAAPRTVPSTPPADPGAAAAAAAERVAPLLEVPDVITRAVPVAGVLQRRRAGVVHRQLALDREQGRPPAGAGGELDDLAADR